MKPSERADYQIRKLKFEIRKRDAVIRNLIEGKDLLYRSCSLLVNLMNDTPMESLDHDAGKEGYEIE